MSYNFSTSNQNNSQAVNPASSFPIPENTLNDSVWYPIEVSAGLFHRNDLEDAVWKIWLRIAWNQGFKCFVIGRSPLWGGLSYCIDIWEVSTILTTYISLTEKGIIPEYDRNKNPDKINEIENQVANKSGKPLGSVKIVLWELYWAWASKDLIGDSVLFPVSSKMNTQLYRQLPKDFNSIKNDSLWGGSGDEPGLFGNILTYLKYGMYAGLGLIALGSGMYLYRNYKEIKFAAKSV